jgi:hypothetical protein
VADVYWNARGGSHTDGGAFVFTVSRINGQAMVSCTDKFGSPITSPPGDWALELESEPIAPDEAAQLAEQIEGDCPDFRAAKMGLSPSEIQGRVAKFFEGVSGLIASWDFHRLRWFIGQIDRAARRDSQGFDWALKLLAMLNDRRFDCGRM